MVAWSITRCGASSNLKLWQFGQSIVAPPTIESHPSQTLNPEGSEAIRAAVALRDSLDDLSGIGKKEAAPESGAASKD